MGTGHRGDPGSAFLKLLYPEQNDPFVDNYLEIPIDLSKLFFTATANNPSKIADELKDLMELYYLSGYTLEEN